MEGQITDPERDRRIMQEARERSRLRTLLTIARARGDRAATLILEGRLSKEPMIGLLGPTR